MPAEASVASRSGCPTGTVVGPRGRMAVRGRSGVLVATVLPYVLNGYMSIEARTTSTGEGKNNEHHPPHHRDRHLQGLARRLRRTRGESSPVLQRQRRLPEADRLGRLRGRPDRVRTLRSLPPRPRGHPPEGRTPPLRDQPLPSPVLRPLPGPTRQDRRGGRPDAGLDGGGHRGSAPDRGEIGGAARPRRAPADPRRAGARTGLPPSTAASTCALPWASGSTSRG